MVKWSADFVNDPDNDFNIVLEILHNEKEIGVIKKNDNNLEITFYPQDQNLTIPGVWLLDLIKEAQKKLD